MAQSRTAKILEQKKTRGGKKITVNLNHDVDGLLQVIVNNGEARVDYIASQKLRASNLIVLVKTNLCSLFFQNFLKNTRNNHCFFFVFLFFFRKTWPCRVARYLLTDRQRAVFKLFQQTYLVYTIYINQCTYSSFIFIFI